MHISTSSSYSSARTQNSAPLIIRKAQPTTSTIAHNASSEKPSHTNSNNIPKVANSEDVKNTKDVAPNDETVDHVIVRGVIENRDTVVYELSIKGKITTFVFPIEHVKFSARHHIYSNYSEALHGQTVGQHVKDGKSIILAVVDLGYLDLAINLYLTSLLEHHLYNYLFICSENTACDILNALNISAYAYVDYAVIGKTASSYFSKQFKKKTHVKTMAILDALKLRYSVLITDVDIVFFKNPFDHFPCHHCDIQITSDEIEGNSGFYFARNTQASIDLHQRAMEMHEKHPELSNQKTLDRTLERMAKSKELQYKMLSREEFPNGLNYYETGSRMWANEHPCSSCVILHNNWIVNNSAKIYRFKEHHHWKLDKDRYYSSDQRKFITYSNPVSFAENLQVEYEALKSAFWIAHVLNRTLIFPQFHKPVQCEYGVCKRHNFCTYNTLFAVTVLDNNLQDLYRESSFLSNDLVPHEVKNSAITSLIIESDAVKNTPEIIVQNFQHVFQPHRSSRGATLEEIKSWFSKFGNTHVLKFNNLYGAIDLDDAEKSDPEFAQRLEQGIKSSDYRQYYIKTVKPEWVAAKTVSGSFVLLFVIPIFVIPCLCIAVCYKIGACEMEEDEEYERRMKSIKRYRRSVRR